MLRHLHWYDVGLLYFPLFKGQVSFLYSLCLLYTSLEALLGKQGSILYSYANGLDDSPVTLYDQREKIKSVGNGITFKRNLKGMEDILTAVTSLADTVASRLRKYQMKAYGVKVDIKDPYFKTISRQKQLHLPTNLASEIRMTSLDVYKRQT